MVRMTANQTVLLVLLLHGQTPARGAHSFDSPLGRDGIWRTIGEGNTRVEVMADRAVKLRTRADLDMGFLAVAKPLSGDYAVEIIVRRMSTTRSGGIYMGAFSVPRGGPARLVNHARELAKVVCYLVGRRWELATERSLV